MKVIYESISQAVRKAVRAADNQNKRISYIELTLDEANALSREMITILSPGWLYRTDYKFSDLGKRVGTLHGVELQIESGISSV